MWTLYVSATRPPVPSALETNPDIHVYASAPAVVTVTPDPSTSWRRTVHVRLPAGEPCPPHAVFGVDLYTSIPNSEGRACRVRTAYETFDLYRLLHAVTQADMVGTLHNRCRPVADQANLAIHVVVAARPPDAVMKGLPSRSAPVDHAAFTRCTTHTLRDLARLTPSHPSLRTMLAPVFTGRTGVYPGIAYWRRPSLVVTERAARHLLDVVLARRRTRPEPVPAGPFAAWSIPDAAAVMADFCTCYPASMPYIADVYPDHQGHMCSYESFDDLFTRGAGDCEDFSAAMVSMFHALRFGGFAWQDPDLRHLVRTSTHYVAASVLAAVTHPSFQQTRVASTRPWAAHMYTKYIPLAQLCARAGLPGTFAPWETTDLREFVGEGTAAVATDFQPAEQAPTSSSSFAAHLDTTLPPGYAVEVSCRWGDPNGFYVRDVHLYTPFFWQRDGLTTTDPVPCFLSYVDAKRPSLYGTPFGDPTARFHVHPGVGAADRRRIDTIMALEAPSPFLDVSAVKTVPDQVVRSAAAFGDAGSNAATDGDTCTIFCSTPDPALRSTFHEVLRGAGAAVRSTTVETFVDGSVPQVRLEVVKAVMPPRKKI